jgi:hypothetical protein
MKEASWSRSRYDTALVPGIFEHVCVRKRRNDSPPSGDSDDRRSFGSSTCTGEVRRWPSPVKWLGADRQGRNTAGQGLLVNVTSEAARAVEAWPITAPRPLLASHTSHST